MELYFKELPIGKIKITGHDFPWTHGTIVKYLEYEKYLDFFNFMISADKDKNNDNGKNFD